MPTKTNWYKVANNLAELTFEQNNMCIVEAGNKLITLALYQNNLYAFAHKCPHASGIMAAGFIDALGNAVCPLHRYKFNIKNGRNTTGEGYYLKTYLVDTKADGIYVGWEDKGFLGLG